MNIIFGANGFIGKNLKVKGERPTRKVCDLLDYESVLNYLSGRQYAEKEEGGLNIINLAASCGGFMFNQKNQFKLLYENSLISLNVMRAIRELDLKCYYLYVSSVCAYDESSINLEDNVLNGKPNKFNRGYGYSKRLGLNALETSILDDESFKDRFAALIPTNMLGPEDSFDLENGHVIPSLIKKMVDGDAEVNVMGNALNKRDFLYSKDFVRIIEIFVEEKISGFYNASTGTSLTIKLLSDIIQEETAYKGSLTTTSGGETSDRMVDNSKIMKVLPKDFGFTPIREALKETIEFYKNEKVATSN